MTFDTPAGHHFKIMAECPTHSRTDITARHHKVVIDEPGILGGTDVAATPLETMLSSYLACLNVISHLLAGERGFVSAICRWPSMWNSKPTVFRTKY